MLDCIKADKNDASGTLSTIGVRWAGASRLTSAIIDFTAKVINTDNSLYQIVP